MNMRAVVSPLHSTVEAVKVDIDGNRRRELFGQIPIPWIKKEHRFDPMNFIKSGRKIVNYDAKELRIWGVSDLTTELKDCLRFLFFFSLGTYQFLSHCAVRSKHLASFDPAYCDLFHDYGDCSRIWQLQIY